MKPGTHLQTWSFSNSAQGMPLKRSHHFPLQFPLHIHGQGNISTSGVAVVSQSKGSYGLKYILYRTRTPCIHQAFQNPATRNLIGVIVGFIPDVGATIFDRKTRKYTVCTNVSANDLVRATRVPCLCRFSQRRGGRVANHHSCLHVWQFYAHQTCVHSSTPPGSLCLEIQLFEASKLMESHDKVCT